MLVVLTEDTKSGKEFIRILCDYCYRNRRVIYNLFSSDYKDKDKEGSNTKLKQAFENLLSDKIINKNDTLLVCFDGIIPNENDFRHTQTVRKLVQDLRYIEDKCRRRGIKYKETDYTCFEELIISYKNLMIVSNYKIHSGYDKEIEQSIVKISNELRNTKSKIDRVELYKKYFNNTDKIEKYLSRGLEKVTGSTNKYFHNWLIDKSKIGICWKELDCNKNVCTKEKLKCKECKVRQKIKDIDNLWYDIINNSNIKQLYDLIIQ